MDIDPSVVPDAETSKLIQPGERPLDDPPPSPKTSAVRGATPGQQRHDVTRAQPAPDGCRVATPVAEHADRPAPGSAAFALLQQNCVDQGEGFLRVVPIGAGHADRKRNALAITNAVCSRALRDRWDSAPFSRRHTSPAPGNCQ